MKNCLLLCIITAMCLSAPAGAVTIDDFAAGDYTLGREGLTIPYTVTDTQLDPTGLHIIGGQRDVSFQKLTGSTTQPYCNVISTYSGGISTFNSSFSCNAVWTMTYGLAGDLNADLTVGGSDAIMVELFSGDMYSGPRPVPMTVTVVSGSGTASHTLQMIDPQTYIYYFTDFPGVDFTDVDMLIFEAVQDSNINDAVDFALSAFYSANSQAVSVESTTWGAVKSLFR